jgi:predicted amidohydrolase
VAAVQASYVLVNRASCMDKAVALIDQAARQGARIVVLPEAFIPGTPIWDGPGIFHLNVDTAPRSSWSST